MSAPMGSYGTAIFSYDKLNAVYDKPCAINAAPLERVGIAVTMDKATYNASAAGVFGYPGDWSSNFVKMLLLVSDQDLTTADQDTIAQNAIVIPADDVYDDGVQVTGQQVISIPEEWAATAQTINFIYQFTHNKAGVIETDYVVIPVRIFVADFEDGTGAGKIQLISVEDGAANDLSKGICISDLPTEVILTFQLNLASPENYLFIPTIRSELGTWMEHNVWANDNLPQLTNGLVLAADEDFTGGVATLTVDPSKMVLGNYCFGAIAKMAALAVPATCTAEISVTLDVFLKMWTVQSFTVQLDYYVVPPVGYTVERMQTNISLIQIGNQPPISFGWLLQVVENDVTSTSGSISYPDNVNGERPIGGQYRFKVEALVRIVEDATGAVCSYNGYYYEFTINTPSESDVLVNYQDSYTHTKPDLSVDDKGKIN